MMPLREVRVLDANAEALGVPVARLVENAGRALARHVQALAAQAPGAGPVVVLAGPGNNGADGLVAARLLAQAGARVDVLLPFPVPDGWKTEHARRAYDALPPEVRVAPGEAAAEVEAALVGASVIVDALLGAGIEGVLREPYRSWVALLAGCRAPVVAADVPTGFGSDATYVPRETVTFHDVKEGMTEAGCGRIHVADVGIPREASLYTGPGEGLLYPHGRPDQHKGEGGIVLVVGGGPYTGAPAIAGLAALRAGADLAIVLTPQRAWQVVASYSPNLVVRPLSGDDLDLDDPANRVALNAWLAKAHAVVLGPGLGLFPQVQRGVHHVLERVAREGKPCVVDADALTALAARRDLIGARSVLTPHAREFQTLAGRALPVEPLARAEEARAAARELGGTWLVKGPVDVVTDGARVKLNATGDPAMSVGGTGDALAGVVAALLAKGLAPFDAARLGAWMTGRAGEKAATRRSWGLVATDVVDALPEAIPPRAGARSSSVLDHVGRA